MSDPIPLSEFTITVTDTFKNRVILKKEVDSSHYLVADPRPGVERTIMVEKKGVQYKFNMDARLSVMLSESSITVPQTTAVLPETAATPEPSAEVAAAAAEEDIDLAPVPLVPAPRPPIRPGRRPRAVPPK